MKNGRQKWMPALKQRTPLTTTNSVGKIVCNSQILDRLAKPAQRQFREMLEVESQALTSVGNRFRIRHSETSQERLEAIQQVDYLFGRLFVLINFILNASGPATSGQPADAT